MQTSTQQWSFTGHSGWVRSAAFAPNNRWAASGGDDQTARLRVTRKGGGMELSWGTGILQKAASPSGPWEDLTAATSPHEVSAAEAAEFYRVKLREL